MAVQKKLKKYQSKRRFDKSPEPSGVQKKKKSKQPIFVIQEHHASHLHFDFRLEIEGVMPSWAVPKGVPKRTGIRRLAVQTEDHPIEYASFAGTIPKGEYGAGEVYIEDHGTYCNLRDVSMADALQEGKIELCLHGQAYKGCYALVRTSLGAPSRKNNWLIMKMKGGKEKHEAHSET